MTVTLDNYTAHPTKVRISCDWDSDHPWALDGWNPHTGYYTEDVWSFETWAQAVDAIRPFVEYTTRHGITWPWTITAPPPPVRVDRYAVNDALTALATHTGVALDDATLNDLTHHVSDVLETQEKWRSRSITLGRIIDTARDLITDGQDSAVTEAENPEYVRALVELITDVTGMPHDTGRDLVRLALRLPLETP